MTTDPRGDERLIMPLANLKACAYNAMVNHGSGRAEKKMRDLVRAFNWYERTEGRVYMEFFVEQGCITSFTECPPECECRPGGLFHADGCPNDYNSEQMRALRAAARDRLPEKFAVLAGAISLVGTGS